MIKDGAMVLDRTGTIIWANRAIRDLLGATDALRGCRLGDLLVASVPTETLLADRRPSRRTGQMDGGDSRAQRHRIAGFDPIPPANRRIHRGGASVYERCLQFRSCHQLCHTRRRHPVDESRRFRRTAVHSHRTQRSRLRHLRGCRSVLDDQRGLWSRGGRRLAARCRATRTIRAGRFGRGSSVWRPFRGFPVRRFGSGHIQIGQRSSRSPASVHAPSVQHLWRGAAYFLLRWCCPLESGWHDRR